MNKELIDTLERLTKTFKDKAAKSECPPEHLTYMECIIEVQNEILKHLHI